MSDRDFIMLRESGARPGAGLLLGKAIGRLRDVVAQRLSALGIGPDALTWFGLAMAAAAGLCLALGAGHAVPGLGPSTAAPVSWWPVIAAVFLTAAAAADMLDGAVARAAGRKSGAGAVLDSVIDRISDCAIYLGCAIYFAAAGNVTMVALSVLAMASAFMVSYVKARAENVIDRCSVGYWQRPERIGVFLLAAYVGHIPAGLWLLSIGPLFTVAARARHAGAALAGSRPPPARGLGRLRIWRCPRGSLGYDVSMASHLAFVIVAPFVHALFAGDVDPLRALLDGIGR